MKGIYVVWALLPISLTLLVVWALYKRVLKLSGREYPKDYIRQVLYSSLVLIAAIIFDQFAYEDIINVLSSDEDTIMIIRWMIYPAFLWLASLCNDFIIKRKTQEEKIGPKKVRVGKPANFR
jgi:hypothetical protein